MNPGNEDMENKENKENKENNETDPPPPTTTSLVSLLTELDACRETENKLLRNICTRLDAQTFPPASYLFLMKQKQRLLQVQREVSESTKQASQQVRSWLMVQPKQQRKLTFDEDIHKRLFGADGSIHFTIPCKYETVNESFVRKSLYKFFGDLYNDRTEDEIEELASAAAKHVFASRTRSEGEPQPSRTFKRESKKRKQDEIENHA